MPETESSGRVGEFELIARHFEPLARGFAGAFGLGDDTARFALPAGRDLVVTTDTLIAGVHFLATDPPDTVARKSLRVSLSDLAAAGAQPLAYQLSTAWPIDIGEDWIAAFTRGLAIDQEAFGIGLSGGDTVATPGPMTITVTAFGTVANGRGLGRGGARPGDFLFVSGTVGDGFLGLLASQGKLGHLSPADREHVVDRYRLPQPRCRLGPQLLGLANACIDVSDGLVADLRHLCDRSGCGAVLNIDRVPLSKAARAAIAEDPALLLGAVTGGDDYELLFSTMVERRADALKGLQGADVDITEIGRFVEGNGVSIVRADGSTVAATAGGWRHF